MCAASWVSVDALGVFLILETKSPSVSAQQTWPKQQPVKTGLFQCNYSDICGEQWNDPRMGPISAGSRRLQQQPVLELPPDRAANKPIALSCSTTKEVIFLLATSYAGRKPGYRADGKQTTLATWTPLLYLFQQLQQISEWTWCISHTWKKNIFLGMIV